MPLQSGESIGQFGTTAAGSQEGEDIAATGDHARPVPRPSRRGVLPHTAGCLIRHVTLEVSVINVPEAFSFVASCEAADPVTGSQVHSVMVGAPAG